MVDLTCGERTEMITLDSNPNSLIVVGNGDIHFAVGETSSETTDQEMKEAGQLICILSQSYRLFDFVCRSC